MGLGVVASESAMNLSARLAALLVAAIVLGCGSAGAPSTSGETTGAAPQPTTTSTSSAAPSPGSPAPSPPPAPSADAGPTPTTGCDPGPTVPHPGMPKLTILFGCLSFGWIEDLAVAGGNVYAATTHGGLLRVATSGGMPEILAPAVAGEQLQRVMLDLPRVFYVVHRTGSTIPAETDLRMVPAPGAAPVVVWTSGPSSAILGATSSASGSLYLSVLTSSTTRAGKVIAVSSTTFAAQPLADVVEPRALAADATHVYVVAWGTGVQRIPVQGGAPETILPTTMERLFGLAIDDTSVYVLDRGSYPKEDDGSILKVSKSGGLVTPVGTVLRGRAGPVLDGANVLLTGSVLPTAGDPGIEPRPLRYAPDGPPASLLSPTLVQFDGRAITADASAYYFSSLQGSHTRVVRLAR